MTVLARAVSSFFDPTLVFSAFMQVGIETVGK
jgi:hypothetical protein